MLSARPNVFKTSGAASSTAKALWQVVQSCVIVFLSDVA